MEKARLTREQAEAIEAALKKRDKQELVAEHVRVLDDEDNGWINNHSALNGLSVGELCQAVYVGYEIEEEDQTVVVTQKVRNMILISYNDDEGSEATDKAYKEGVRMVLGRLNIVIDGINA